MAERATKKHADYSALGHKDSHCGPVPGWRLGECRYYHAPNECEKVEGYISPKGWCKYWSKEAEE